MLSIVLGLAVVWPAEQAAAPGTAMVASVASPADVVPADATTPSLSGLDAIDADGKFAVAVLDIDSGESLTYGEEAFDTASIVKVDILAALLWQHQQAGTSLSATERAQAAAMIQYSDNASATALFNAVGGRSGLELFNESIGLEDTVVGSNGSWGLTQTTATDQIRLLQVVFGAESVLTADSQAYEQSLMSGVVHEQVLGVSAAADDPDDAALKVGYLQRSATGLWDVTSIGQIKADGRTYLVAVLTDGSPSLESGVDLADQVARAAVSALTAI
ncbi:hypothetical protein C6I20_01620 [Aeromicrobium sp. A1-2]|nr:hypothetical protein C6I20_01620 [Aeromicrobium sp. A1-2]